LPLNKPEWWSAGKGTIAGITIGFIGAYLPESHFRQVIHRGKTVGQWILTHLFSKLIPIFVLGFVARMSETKLLHQVVHHYGQLLIWLVFFLALYILSLFFIGNGLSPSRLVRSIKNLLPAGGISFSSGCSLSTMPWTIEGAAKNCKNPDLAKAVIPATTNIQQIGDCITNAFLCFLIYRHFYGQSPDLATWLHFSIIFVLARFATAAVLGGTIFIMLPIYETYLSFNTEMIAIILAFNVILDPLVTSCNVMANGALCPIFEKGWLFASQKWRAKKEELSN
jgi:Na+/H+-dicarboxylate symporter